MSDGTKDVRQDDNGKNKPKESVDKPIERGPKNPQLPGGNGPPRGPK